MHKWNSDYSKGSDCVEITYFRFAERFPFVIFFSVHAISVNCEKKMYKLIPVIPKSDYS